MRPASRWAWLFPASPRHAALLAFCLAFPIGMLAALLGISGYGLYDGYMAIADSLVHGHGYRFSAEEPLVLHRPPVYPLLLAPIAALPQWAWRPGLVVLNSLLVALASAQTFALGRRWFGPTIAGWAALAFLTNPWLLVTMHTTRTYFPETVFYLLLSTWFLEGVLSPAKITWRQAALFGALGGVMTLTHASKLLTVGLLVGLLALSQARRSLASIAIVPAVALLAMAAVIAPWTYRNWVVTQRLIPVATNAGYGYFAGNAHWGITQPMEGPDEGWPQAALRHSGVEFKADEVGRFWGLYTAELNDLIDRRMRAHVRAHPAEFLGKFAGNAVEFYFPVVHPIYAKLHGDTDQSWRQVVANPRTIGLALVSAYHLALWSAAIAGFFAGPAAGDRRAAWALLVLVGAFALPYFPFLVKAGFMGYTGPTLPLLSLLAARSRALLPGAP